LLANISDFNPGTDTVPDAHLLEIDRYALARTAQLQADVLAHYNQFEFHPVVSKLQIFCSEDLGAFYLDVLKDRLYTTAPNSLARRSAQTALHRITHAFVRMMAPFLSFTAEEAYALMSAPNTTGHESIFMSTYTPWPQAGDESQQLMERWSRIRHLRDAVNKQIEAVRITGAVGSSLQACVTLTLAPADHALLSQLGADLKFVFIASEVTLQQGTELAVHVVPSTHAKCERCWHYCADVGTHADHPGLCGRCISNLHGAGEVRTVA
jgi:isoleucyl-tRNA synthetase